MIYIVLDKTTGVIEWTQKVPNAQELTDADVWAFYRPVEHEIITFDNENIPKPHTEFIIGAEMPETLKVESGIATKKTLEELADDGITTAPDGMKFVGDSIVSKTTQEKLDAGDITLEELKSAAIKKVRAHYNGEILAQYPIETQLNVVRLASGYAPSDQDDMEDFIDGKRNECHTTEAAINAATQLGEIEEWL